MRRVEIGNIREAIGSSLSALFLGLLMAAHSDLQHQDHSLFEEIYTTATGAHPPADLLTLSAFKGRTTLMTLLLVIGLQITAFGSRARKAKRKNTA